ncbi:MAG: TonB-dependent receptor [Proteobacteria bacterium]|nr:TonB-dependent receptor [Pseudomonadota bacterium]
MAGVVVAALGLTNPAQAQSSSDSADDYIDEIIVTTARRREESLQEVPLSITVISGDHLERIGAADIIAIGQSSPNVTLEVSRGTNSTLTAFIRGVGQQDPVAGFESGVGLYVDDVYFNRPHAAVLDLYEVERIEVLRGPQGTLYGRNTIGGAIKYVTRPLSDEPEGKVRLSVGTDNQLDGLVSGSVPLSDTFRVGGTIAKFTRDGFGDNLNLSGVEQYDKDIFGARLTLEWDATDNLFFRLSGDKTEDDSNPKAGHRLMVGGVSGAPILPDVFDTRAGLNVPGQSVESNGVSLLAEWTLNDRFMLKNILAYREDETWSPIDFDSLPVDDLDVPVVYTNEQFSEELQLLYSGDRLNGIVGFYYLDANAFNEFDVVLNPLGVFLGLPGGLNANTLGDVDTETWSVFADFTYDFSDTVSLSLGGRYTSDERSSRVLRRSFTGGFSPTFGGSAIVFATTSDFNGSAKDTEFSPRVSLSWQPTDEQHLYFSYSEGFKGGSFDPRALTTAAPDLDGDGTVSEQDIFNFMRFEPETVKSYEIGWKSSMLDNRLMASLAVFFADYEDVQIPGSVAFDSDGDGTNDTFAGVTTNAGKAELPGVEFEGLFRASDNWSFGWAIGYLDAEYKEFIDATGTDVANLAVFQNTPEWTASGSVTFETPLSLFGASGNFAVITSLSYRDDTSQFEFPNALLDQESFTLWDLSLIWEDDDGRWRVSVHGKNLTDEEYKVAGYDFPTLGLEGNVTAFYGYPSTVTGTVEYRF